MLRSGGLLLVALLVGELVAPVPLKAAEPRVVDQAQFFSKAAVEQATRKVQEIRRRFKVDVVIETFPSIPENMKAEYKPEEKKAFFLRWADARAAGEGVKGIYVLICKNPGHLQIAPDQLTIRKREFTLEESAALVRRVTKLMDQKQFDAALSEMVNTIESTLATNLGQRSGRAVPPAQGIPNSWPLGGAGQSSPLVGWICLGVVVLLVVWLI